MFYSFALCLGATDFLMFFSFLERDVEYNIYLNHGEEQWRINVMWVSQTVPFGLLLLDFCLNSLITIPRIYHVLVIPFLLLYLFITFMGQYVTDEPSYLTYLDWYDSKDLERNFLFCGVLFVASATFHTLFYFVSRWKSLRYEKTHEAMYCSLRS